MGDFYDDVDDPNKSRPPIVCSLCTIRPTTFYSGGRPEKSQSTLPDNGQKQDAADDPIPKEEDNKPQINYEFSHPMLPSVICLQKNITSQRRTEEHIITWSSTDDVNPESLEAKQLTEIGRGPATGTGDLVRNLEIGDVVTVWAKERFPGWTNNVEDVTIDVYWKV